MKALLTAIYSHYTAATTSDLYEALYVSATRGGLYPDNAPQGADFPFCVYGIHNRIYEPEMDDEHEEITVFFNVYSRTGPANALDLADYVADLFDDADVSVDYFRRLYFTRDTMIPLHDIASDPPVYGYAIHYDVLLERGRLVFAEDGSGLVVPTVGAGGLGLIAVDPVSTDTVQLSAPVVPTISVNASVAPPPTT
jgi:hypothetical protein